MQVGPLGRLACNYRGQKPAFKLPYTPWFMLEGSAIAGMLIGARALEHAVPGSSELNLDARCLHHIAVSTMLHGWCRSSRC